MSRATIIGISALIILVIVMIVFIGARLYAFFRANANPTISTFPHLKNLMKDLTIPPHATFLDLGCGNGSTLRRFAQHYPGRTYTGVDINRLALWRGRLMNRRTKHTDITLLCEDMYTLDLKHYDVVYCFLMPSEMKRVQDHFSKNLGHHTIVIAAAFKLPDREPYHTVAGSDGTNKIYCYHHPDASV